jgi:hypothetical protein
MQDAELLGMNNISKPHTVHLFPFYSLLLHCSLPLAIRNINFSLYQSKNRMFEDSYADVEEAMHSGNESRSGGEEESSKPYNIKV